MVWSFVWIPCFGLDLPIEIERTLAAVGGWLCDNLIKCSPTDLKVVKLTPGGIIVVPSEMS